MAQRKWAAILSIILFSFSLITLAVNGLNWGLDFTGGTQVQLSFPQQANSAKFMTTWRKLDFQMQLSSAMALPKMC